MSSVSQTTQFDGRPDHAKVAGVTVSIARTTDGRFRPEALDGRELPVQVRGSVFDSRRALITALLAAFTGTQQPTWTG